MVPTKVDYGNTDDPKVMEKMSYIYGYRISMFKRGYIKEDDLKDAVLNKVAGRVGMDGPAFRQVAPNAGGAIGRRTRVSS